MSDASYVELPPQPSRAPLWRSWRGVVLLLVLGGIVCAGWFSWWLSEGKISSIQARVDANVHTVEAAFPCMIEGILTRQGDHVAEGQALARVDNREQVAALQRAAPVQDNGEIAGRLAASAEMERRMAVRLAEARAEEERYQQMHQQMVTEHVRQQLYLRSINPSNMVAWEQAKRAEEMAKSRMEAARADFERVSKMRAAVDTELNRIRGEIVREKNRASLRPKPVAPVAPPPPMPNVPDTLVAPVSGEVFSVEAQAGQRVEPGQTIFIILPANETDRDRWIQALFPANTRKMLKIGQKAQVSIRDHVLPALVADIAPEDTTIQRGTLKKAYVPVRLTLVDQDFLENIAPGTNVECQIQTRYLLGEEYF